MRNYLVPSQAGVPPQHAQPQKETAFKPIPTLFYLVKSNPRGVYHYLKDNNIHPQKTTPGLYQGVKQFVRNSSQDQVIQMINAVHPDKKYFDSPNTNDATGDLTKKISEWELEKGKTSDPNVQKILDDLINKGKKLLAEGKVRVEDLVEDLQGGKKDKDFYKKTSIILVVVVILLILTRK